MLQESRPLSCDSRSRKFCLSPSHLSLKRSCSSSCLSLRVLVWCLSLPLQCRFQEDRDSVCFGYHGFPVWHIMFVSQSLSCVLLFATPRTAAHQASLSFTISWYLLKLMSTELVMLSNHLVLCHPLLLLPSIFPSIRVFYSESALCIRWPKYWSFSFSISPSSTYSGLISFRIDWFDLLAVQGTLKTLLQHRNSKASILQHSALKDGPIRTSVCMSTGKIRALTIWTFVGKMLSLLFNMLSRFLIAFLPRSKHLLTSYYIIYIISAH